MDGSTDTRPALILIVDDDPVVRSLMRAVLEGGGLAMLEASDGEEACQCCEQCRPDLIVADVVMPGMDGFALCRELRRRPAFAYVPILVATGLDDLDSVTEAYEAGATDFIPKPITWLVLLHRVRYMLRAGRAAEELIAARDAAEDANRAKTEFLANMSHELRTPLHSIIGFSSLMRDAPLVDVARNYMDYASTIADSGTHLLGMIDDILELTQAEANKLTLSKELIEVAAVVARSVRSVTEMARQASVDVSASVADGLPKLYADAAKLQRILGNLLSNAVKFTPVGGQVRLVVASESPDFVSFRIEDTGIGMAEEEIPIALAPFRQVDGGFSRKYGGAGLGLPLTKHLIELHGGTMEIVSAPGQGTAVTVRFPILGRPGVDG